MSLINESSVEFLEKKQHGIYEDIRKALLEKGSKNKLSLLKLAKKHDVLSKYLKFTTQIDGNFGDDFDSIFESETSFFRNLFISSKIFHDKYFDDMRNLPFFLNIFMQYRKGVVK